jgi:aminopeptidase N
MIAVFDDEGWNIENPPEYGDIVYADSGFYVVRVTAPARQTLVASGIQIEQTTNGDDQVITYAAGPMRDFYLVASDQFRLFSQTVGQTTINSYGILGDGTLRTLEHAADALRVYNERIGVYPFTELDLVSTPNLAYGIEYPGMIAAKSFEGSFTGRWARVNRERIPIGMPVARYEDFEYGAIVYGRGPLFFAELAEDQLGGDRFNAFLHDYYQTYQWGIATTEGLKRVAERVCACDLTPMFQEWVYPR